MAVVRFKCDTCDRVIDIIRNKQGLETFGRCNITNGCKGKLKFQQVLPNFIVGQLPPDIEGLDNWVQRKLLYTHTQTVKRKEWTIKHFLATEPSIQTHIYDGDVLVEIEPFEIITIDKNTSKVIFSQAYSGIAQCISRSTNIVQPISKTETIAQEETYTQASVDNVLIFASTDDLSVANVRINWHDSKSNSLGFVDQIVEPNSTILPWGDYSTVLYKGKPYTIYTVDITPPNNADNGSSFYFTTDGGVFNPENSIVLFSKPPFSEFDIVKNKIFNMSSIDLSSTFLYSSLHDGELFIGDSKIKKVYPPLKTY